MWQTKVSSDNSVSATTDTIGLEMKRGASDQWEQLGNNPCRVDEPQVLTVEQKVVLEFIVYSWSSPIVRGKEIMGLTFNTTTVNRHLTMNSLKEKGINSSNISITWSMHDILVAAQFLAMKCFGRIWRMTGL